MQLIAIHYTLTHISISPSTSSLHFTCLFVRRRMKFWRANTDRVTGWHTHTYIYTLTQSRSSILNHCHFHIAELIYVASYSSYFWSILWFTRGRWIYKKMLIVISLLSLLPEDRRFDSHTLIEKWYYTLSLRLLPLSFSPFSSHAICKGLSDFVSVIRHFFDRQINQLTPLSRLAIVSDDDCDVRVFLSVCVICDFVLSDDQQQWSELMRFFCIRAPKQTTTNKI